MGLGQQKARNALSGKPIPGTSNDTGGGLGLLGKKAHLLKKLVLGHVLGPLERVRLGDLPEP